MALETGEDVVAVPKPPGMPLGAKWSKFCPVSVDYRDLDVSELLDKHETTYNDYVSVHIKVSKNKKAWTYQLKDYFELMSPQKDYPFYFSHRDERGDNQIGKQFGPDSQQIMKVDGPHSAPSEHYVSYKTVMLAGAGIGLTPCASILSALLRYRWKQNFGPEIVHFYWTVAFGDIAGFQWFVHLLADIQYELIKARESGVIGPRCYCEINIYVRCVLLSVAVAPVTPL